MDPQWSPERKRNYQKHALRECQIHRSITHPRVVHFVDVFVLNEMAFCTVLELCEGDLDTYLKVHKTMPEKDAKVIVAQIASALHCLATQDEPIIHFDLKPGNILFQRGEVRITDFGLAKIMDNKENRDATELTSFGSGTYWYLPPECLSGPKELISTKVDVWSLGVICFQLLFGSRPFGNGMSQQEILQSNVINSNTQLTFSNVKGPVSEEAKVSLLSPPAFC